MKAMVLRGPNTPFVLEQRPDPVAGAGEAVARVITCGAGLTIQHVKAGRRKVQFPRIIGHEITGEIVETGPGVKRDQGRRRGDGRVLISTAAIAAGACKISNRCAKTSAAWSAWTATAPMTEYVKLPAQNFIKLPDGLDHKKHAAEIGVVTDALATPYKVLRRARVAAGETVAVIGAGGGLGIHQVMMAKWRADAGDRRRHQAEEVEARRKACVVAEVVDASQADVAEQLIELTKGQGVDVVIDYVSATATLEAGAKALWPERPAGDARRLGQDVPGLRGGHALQGAGPARQPLCHAQRNRRIARSGRARRGVPAGHRAAAAGGGRGRARTGRARRGDRPRRVAGDVTVLG